MSSFTNIVEIPLERIDDWSLRLLCGGGAKIRHLDRERDGEIGVEATFSDGCFHVRRSVVVLSAPLETLPTDTLLIKWPSGRLRVSFRHERNRDYDEIRERLISAMEKEK